MTDSREAISVIATITHRPQEEIASLLADGWEFSWDIRGNWAWKKNAASDLVRHPKNPLYPGTISAETIVTIPNKEKN